MHRIGVSQALYMSSLLVGTHVRGAQGTAAAAAAAGPTGGRVSLVVTSSPPTLSG